MLLLRMHRHPGDANYRLASEWFEIKFISSTLLSLNLDPSARKQLIALTAMIDADQEWLQQVEKPRKIGRIQNRTAANYIALLMRLRSEYLE